MASVHITLGGYQPPTSVHNRAAEIFGKEMTARVGDAVTFDMDGNKAKVSKPSICRKWSTAAI